MRTTIKFVEQGRRNRGGQSAWRRLALGLLACLWMAAWMGMDVSTTGAKATRTPKNQGYNPYDVIAAVNSVRAANGLPGFQTNGALMAAAQAHSEYQASIGSTTHTGQGGSDVKSRALAAGYGGGENISVVENIYGGMNATPQQAVNWWQGDSLHLDTLLSTRHTDAGAGVATSGGVVYYTLDVGSVSGGPVTVITPVAGSSVLAPAIGTVSSYPFPTATPRPDGAIIHVVQPGQTLWMIAAVYQAPLADILRINGLYADAFIVPGQKILIRAAGSQLSETPAETQATARPTREPKPTRTPTNASTIQALLPPTRANTIQSPKSAAIVVASKKVDPVLVMIGLLVVGGVILTVVGSLLKSKR